MFPNRMTPRRPRAAAPLTPAQAAAPAAAALPKEVVMTIPTSKPISQYRDVDTQPLWYRLKVAAGTVLAGGVSVDAFTTKRNAAPHLTNCEESGAMPNSAEFYVSGIEVIPNAGADAAAFTKLLANSRLVLEVGTKNYEKVNQPAVLFHSAGVVPGTGLDNSAKIGHGLYTLKAGEEIVLAADQPFRARFVMDDDGVTLGATEPIDCFVVFRGQKRSRVSVG